MAVAFLVGCASNLLICEDLPALPDRFADVAACRTALPALVQRHAAQENGPPVVMGKCHLLIRPDTSVVPDPAVLAGSLR